MKRALLGIFVLSLLLGSVGCCNPYWRRGCMGCGDAYWGDWYESPACYDGCGSHAAGCRNWCDPCCRPIFGWWRRLLADFEQPYCGYCGGVGCDMCYGGECGGPDCPTCHNHGMPGEVIHDHGPYSPQIQDDGPQPSPAVPKPRVTPPPSPPVTPMPRPMPDSTTRMMRPAPESMTRTARPMRAPGPYR